MEWREEKWDEDMLSFHRAMGEARKDAWLGFSSYSVISLDEEAFAILRFVEGKAYVAVINRGEDREVEVPLFLLPSNRLEVIVGSGDVKKSENSLKVRVKEKESLLVRLEN